MDYSNMSLEQLLNYKDDNNSWYWIGMAYMGKHDAANVIKWLGKAADALSDDDNWKGKATQELAIAYWTEGHEQTDKNKALELFNKYPDRPTCNIFAGFTLYDDFNKTKEGRVRLEKGIQGYKEHGFQLDPIMLSNISHMYGLEREFSKAENYYKQALALCDEQGMYDLKEYII